MGFSTSRDPDTPEGLESWLSVKIHKILAELLHSTELEPKKIRRILINTILKAKLIERGIPELSPIVTADGFQAVGILIVQPKSQALKVLKHFIFALQEENPIITRIVINNNKNIPLASHGVNLRGTDSVHME
jgi:hypothetical protein